MEENMNNMKWASTSEQPELEDPFKVCTGERMNSIGENMTNMKCASSSEQPKLEDSFKIRSKQRMNNMQENMTTNRWASSEKQEVQDPQREDREQRMDNMDMGENMTYMKQASSSEVLEERLKKLTEDRRKESKVDIGRYRPLIRVMLENNVKAQREFLFKNPEALTAEIDEFGNTIFHFIVQESVNTATIKLLEELVSKVSPETLEKEDINNLTALDIAASAGNTRAVQVFVKANKSLLSKKKGEHSEILPVHLAAYWCRKETVRYLLSAVTDGNIENLSGDRGALLLQYLIESNLHGIALELLKHYPQLAKPDQNSLWKMTVNRLAEKYLAFRSGRKPGFWESLIYHYIPVKDDEDRIDWPDFGSDIEMQNHISSIKSSEESPILPQIAATIGALIENLWNPLIDLVPSIKNIHDQKQMHSQTLQIVRMMISEVNWTYKEAVENLKEPVLTAARLGIHDFVNEVLKAYPNSVLFRDEIGHNIFLLAVLHRKEKVFNLIHDQVASIRDHTNYIQDQEGCNILHLAGRLVPSSQVPGAALQMQRELQWFTGIRDLFQPSLQEQRNQNGVTPGKEFTILHEKLVEKGEKWMRDTATSCSVVAALIITIVFAAAFTVPGGIDTNGTPNYLDETYFRIFAVSNALALFSSTTSVQMFLGMLTSRYAERDFLKALPKKLIVGLVTLFLSSSSMMIAFGAAFCIALSHPWKWVIILICLLGCLPVTLFAWMQFPLLVDICISTYGPGILKPKKYV